MGKTLIEWTDASWNPIVGCTEVSPGCANCYAARLAATRLREVPAYKDLASGTIQKKLREKGSSLYQREGIRWTGEVRLLPHRLDEPMHWKKPQRIFVCDMGDVFHEAVKTDWWESIFETILHCPQHTFQILTKRPQRMKEWFTREWRINGSPAKTVRNLWLGVSVENQHFADERIPLLLQTPGAAVRFISAEPLLGPVDIRGEFYDELIDWVICGGESGPNARLMDPQWARNLRDQCNAAGVPFFFKQWGEWGPILPTRPGKSFELVKMGKKRAGRLLDGREWSEFPK